MRPLAVLLLVVGALASLGFAMLSLLDGGRGTTVITQPVVRPVGGGEVFAKGDDPVLPREVNELQPEPVRTALLEEESGVEGAHTGLIRGMVVAVDGTPIKNAEVGLVRRRHGSSALVEALQMVDEGQPAFPERKAQSDAAGRFQFASLEPSNDWLLVVSHEQYAKVEVGPIDVPERGGVDELVTLRSGLALYGKISDASSGLPIAGALVVVDSPFASMLPSSRKSRAREEAITDSSGNYSFTNIGAGQRTLSIAAEGFATKFISNFGNEIRAEVSASRKPAVVRRNQAKVEAELDLLPAEPIEKNYELDVGQSIAGRIVGPDLSGIPDVVVNAVNQTGSSGSRGNTVSVEDGEFVINDLGPGVYTLFAEADGFQSTPLQRIDVGRTDVEMMLARQGSVSGRVVDAVTGKAMSGYTVRIRSLHPRNISWGGVVGKKVVRDQRDGAFLVEGISEGDYVAEAFARDYASSFSAPFRVEQGIQTRSIVVRLTKGGSIKGKVLDSYTGEPIAGARVETKENNYVDSEIMLILGSAGSTATSIVETTTNEEGEYELSLLTPDVYQVRIEKRGFTTEILNDVKASDGAVTNMGTFRMLRGAVVTGTVLGPTGDPIAGANVVLRSVEPNDYSAYDTRTNANGLYTLRNAKAGMYKLSASRPPNANSNPFEAVVDINNSEIEIAVVDGGHHEHDLSLARTPRNESMKLQ